MMNSVQKDKTNALSGQDILITGGAGFIGSNLAIALDTMGARVMIVDNLVDGHGGQALHLSGLSSGAAFHRVALESGHPAVVETVRRAGVIFHLAGQSHHWMSMEDPLSDLQHNCASTLALLDICRRVNPSAHIIFTSTRQVYGVPQKCPVDEQHPLRALDVNGIHKQAAEQYLLLYQHAFQIPVTIARLTNTYGPGMRISDAGQSFLGYWVKRALEGTPFDVWGGGQLRDVNHVEDVVRALILMACEGKARGKIYNVGCGEAVSLSKIASLVSGLTGTPHRVIDYPEDRKKIEIGDYCADIGLLRSDLGWEPSVPLEEGLGATIAYYRTHLHQYVQQRPCPETSA